VEIRTPLQWKLRVTPTVEIKGLTPTVEICISRISRDKEIMMTEECQECQGEGKVEYERWERYGDTYEPYAEYSVCEWCLGTGQLESDDD